MDFVSKKYNRSKFRIWQEVFKDSIKLNVSILDYFLFRFYEIPPKEKETFAGTGYMYEYQLLMNPKSTREIMDNKLVFLSEYKDFVKHSFASLSDFENEMPNAQNLLKGKDSKIVLKNSRGQCGNGIEVRRASDFNSKTVVSRLKETQNDFVEEFVDQHDQLNKLSPSGLNTVRIITQLDKNNEVKYLGARLRITVNSEVDNLAAGNLAAPIDLDSGIVSGPGVYSDITKSDEEIHPVTGERILGFQVPFWPEIIFMTKQAASLNKMNRSIGWDVAVTNKGPELIEANHDWCKWLWQLPVKQGLKPILEKHREEYIR
jgi:hypothetical protein